MHPLDSNLKEMTFEDLEKRKTEIMKRLQIMRRSGIQNEQMGSQLELFLDSIILEQEERFHAMNEKRAPSPIVVNTDPLPDDPVPEEKNPRNNKFTPVS